MRSIFILPAISIVLSLFTIKATFAQTNAAKEELLKKVDNPEIVRKATIGTPQKLIVTLDTTSELSALRKRHEDRHAEKLGRPASAAKERFTEAEETEFISESKIEIDKVKGSVVRQGRSGRSRVVEDFSHAPIFIIEITDIDALYELLRHDKVKAVSQVPGVKPSGANNLNLIGQPITASAGFLGDNTRVAVIDLGLNVPVSAPLAGKVLHQFEWNSDTGALVPLCSYNRCPDVFGYHGQNVSEILLSVAPATKISFLRALSGLDVIRALNWTLSNYQFQPRIVAVNMSLNLTYSDGLNPGEDAYTPVYAYSCAVANSAIANLISIINARDIVVVAATGNGSNARSIAAPACMPYVLSVGAVADSTTNVILDCNGNGLTADKIPCFSNGGPLVRILAPGVGIADSSGYGYSGTSQASPHVAGAVAVLRGSNGFPTETNTQIVDRLISTGTPVFDSRASITIPRLQLDKAAGVKPIGIKPPNCRSNPRLCA